MSQIRVVDASFQFYEHLLSIDLSDNIIEDIEDKSFAAQVSPLPHPPTLVKKRPRGAGGPNAPLKYPNPPLRSLKE